MPTKNNWLGLARAVELPVRRLTITSGQTALLGKLLGPHADFVATQETDVVIRCRPDGLWLKATCHTRSMGRVKKLAARTAPPARDAWGDDAIEVQIDTRCKSGRYRHFIITPSGHAVTFTASNNLQDQGWHPDFAPHVRLDDASWSVEAFFSFDMLGCTAVTRQDIWGFNFMRVNPSEKSGYVQWAPTYGDALRPELFGQLCFAGPTHDRANQVDALLKASGEREEYFKRTINQVTADDALRELNMPDWSAWAKHISKRESPLPLRWEDYITGAGAMPERDREMSLQIASQLVDEIGQWTQDPPDKRAFGIERLEALGDAYILTGAPKYVAAFERAIALHDLRVEEIASTVTGPDQLHHSSNPYHDAQIIRVEMLSYVYLSMRQAGLSESTHKCMMRAVLRGCRFAACNIGRFYCYGNHQVYESGGLASVAALFPEFRESDTWATTAARAIRFHLENNLYPDGGYHERCGYHSVAMSYAMHAVATIKASGLEPRFDDLMNDQTQARLEKMHAWVNAIAAPDGTMPAFGDYSAFSQHRFLARGAALFNRPDFAWHLKNHTPELVPHGMTPKPPDHLSLSLESQFTVMRDGWSTNAFYMALDHGPLSGQHSHLDTLGFVAYAHGVPVALDTGIGNSYDDPRYLKWFRALKAHNVVVIDGAEPEKVARRSFWETGPDVESVGMQSDAYRHTLGITHDRTVHFIKGVGWVIQDQLQSAIPLEAKRIDWMLHTPMELAQESPGVLAGPCGLPDHDEGVGLLVVASDPTIFEDPVLEKLPASVPQKRTMGMRLWDMGKLKDYQPTAMITSLSWRLKPITNRTYRSTIALIPYQTRRPKVEFVPDPNPVGPVRLRVDGRLFETCRSSSTPKQD